MTRRFLDDVRSDLTALLVTGGETTADELLTLWIDTIDSTIQDECAIASTETTDNIDTTTEWTKLNSTTFGMSVGGDGVFLKPNHTSGEITTNSVPGYSYEIGAAISFEGQQNTRFDFRLMEDGVPVGAIDIQTGEGNNDPITAQPTAYISSANSDAVFSVGVRSPDGDNDIEVISAVLYARIIATNNP